MEASEVLEISSVNDHQMLLLSVLVQTINRSWLAVLFRPLITSNKSAGCETMAIVANGRQRLGARSTELPVADQSDLELFRFRADVGSRCQLVQINRNMCIVAGFNTCRPPIRPADIPKYM